MEALLRSSSSVVWILGFLFNSVICGSVVDECSGADVLLNCVCSLVDTPDKAVIHWTDKQGNIVLDILHTVPDLNSQHRKFRGRVDSFPDLYKKGNFSIILKNVQLSDSGPYDCYVPWFRFHHSIRLTVTESPPPPAAGADAVRQNFTFLMLLLTGSSLLLLLAVPADISMASPFKIPKKKHPTASDSDKQHMQSPLSRLQSPGTAVKSYGDQSNRREGDRMHAGNTFGSATNTQSKPCQPLFRDVMKTLLGLNSPNTGGSSAANHRSPEGSSGPSQLKSSSDSLCNGWRPKRASDRLLQPDVASKHLSPPQKKSDLNGLSALTKSITVESVDSLADVRGEEHAGSVNASPLGGIILSRVKTGKSVSPEPPLKPQKENSSLSGSDHTSDDDFVSPPRPRIKPSGGKSPPCRKSSSSSVTSGKLGLMLRTTPDRKRTLDRTSWLAASSNLIQDVREKERQRWFRDRKTPIRSAILQMRLKKPRETQTEPIVLSSEDEEEHKAAGDRLKRTPQSCSSADESRPGNSEEIQVQLAGEQVSSIRDERDAAQPAAPLTPPPSFLQLEFTLIHVGFTCVDANGEMMIGDSGIIIPLKGAEDGEVTVVASQVLGYGVWDGGVAQGGKLLAGWEGPAPSLLFLWVSDAQANLLQRELAAIKNPSSTSGLPCAFLLLVLKEQLQELQAALLASILDMEEYQKGRASSPARTSPLDWTDGLVLLHSCPPPLNKHLLRLLGQSESSQERTRKSTLNSSDLQQLPSRLIQYPAAPCKGRITVTKEDLACLNSGEFLNDVIIDFYLKYLILEGVGGSVAERSHVFSSFFYKQLSRRRAAGEDDVPSVPDRHMRHQRVKTWTRHVDIFTKDFLFVPVNHEAHWYLVVVCFPGLEENQYAEFQRPAGVLEKTASSLRSQQLPECTQQGWQKDTVLKRPCILVMDSLKLSYHENVCRLLRDYLQVEWEVRRGTPRLFMSDMRSCYCRVPQQDNSSDCGLYLLQYVESFLQNPVVHFDFPLRLDNWFPRQQVRQKREEIRTLIMTMHQNQRHDEED
ncbi:hypothetical protein Q5P01_005974 [Channa striata]|uniref:Ubiquitin-like protease family profile domain-containing protein n=1 Tax=Channa striata TaxID=64152 RepID=A0AA88NEK8_CHASR|nr:hypothetical protein Q5P01_005974 [Channa striata]